MMEKIKLITFAAVFTLFSTVTVFAGTWECDSKGWWYQKETGNYPANTWLEIDNKWYYFNEKGYMQTGWIQSDDKWYYCGLNGGLVTDQWIDGKYYVGSDGAMYVNTTTPDGSKVDNTGEKAIVESKSLPTDTDISCATEIDEESMYLLFVDSFKGKYRIFKYKIFDSNNDGKRELLVNIGYLWNQADPTNNEGKIILYTITDETVVEMHNYNLNIERGDTNVMKSNNGWYLGYCENLRGGTSFLQIDCLNLKQAYTDESYQSHLGPITDANGNIVVDADDEDGYSKFFKKFITQNWDYIE